MVRIPLHVRSWFGEKAIFLTFVVRGHPHIRPISIEGMVDTGSPWLAVSPQDCEALGISTKSLSLPSENIDVRMAGIKFKRMVMKNVEIVFLDENQNPVRIKMPYISVLEPTKHVGEKVPSVVGMDFIRCGNLSFHYDYKKEEAYFEQ